MYWRSAKDFNLKYDGPITGGQEWPRNGSVLKGTVHDNVRGLKENGTKCIEVSEWKQSGSEVWIQASGLFMPFDVGRGGPLLHKIE